ncbi:MAG TPA: DUF3343 domain-containing protein [Deltaproteobacteria bacterium]|nr:DUF3343 domain-containing protein [Deltaproteobacteria bacterium]
MQYILAFSTTHKVLKAESLLKDSRIKMRLDPAPIKITGHCEIVITLEEEVLEQALSVLSAHRVHPSAIYRKEEDGYVKV